MSDTGAGARTTVTAPAVTSTASVDVPTSIDSWSAHYGVDRKLARALAWQESGFQQSVISNVGATGVMQVMPHTWQYVEEVLLQGRKVPNDANGNVRIGVAFLHHLLNVFSGDERLAVGAYYQGLASVRHQGLFPETKQYVANVLALKTRM
jgi:soluble lytic murein transglycosylase-like protein